MSAYSNLAGLYPPVGQQIWNKDLLWQPIPVETKPASEDNVSKFITFIIIPTPPVFFKVTEQLKI